MNQILNYFIWQIYSPFHHIQQTSTTKHTATFSPSTVSEAEPSMYQLKNDIKRLHFILPFSWSHYTQYLLQSTQVTTWYTNIHICSGYSQGPCRPHVMGVSCCSGVPKEENTNICCGFFQTERLDGSYSNFSNNYMKVPNYYVEGNARPVNYATAYMWIIHTHPSLLLLHTVVALITFKLI